MRKRYWIVGGAVLGVLATVALAELDTRWPRSVPKWEYGMYITEIAENGEKRVSWYEWRGHVANCSPYEFCQKIGVPASNTKVDDMAVTPTFDVTIFEVLGSRGWELISNPEKDSKHTTYLFKRRP